MWERCFSSLLYYSLLTLTLVTYYPHVVFFTSWVMRVGHVCRVRTIISCCVRLFELFWESFSTNRFYLVYSNLHMALTNPKFRFGQMLTSSQSGPSWSCASLCGLWKIYLSIEDLKMISRRGQTCCLHSVTPLLFIDFTYISSVYFIRSDSLWIYAILCKVYTGNSSI